MTTSLVFQLTVLKLFYHFTRAYFQLFCSYCCCHCLFVCLFFALFFPLTVDEGLILQPCRSLFVEHLCH